MAFSFPPDEPGCNAYPCAAVARLDLNIVDLRLSPMKLSNKLNRIENIRPEVFLV